MAALTVLTTNSNMISNKDHLIIARNIAAMLMSRGQNEKTSVCCGRCGGLKSELWLISISECFYSFVLSSFAHFFANNAAKVRDEKGNVIAHNGSENDLLIHRPWWWSYLSHSL